METEDGLELLSGVLMFFFLTIALPAFLLYGLGAASEQANLVKYFFYGVLGFSPLLVNFATVFLENRGFFEKHPSLKGFQYITFHSPEQTPLGQKFPKLVQAKVMIPLFIVIALFFGMLVSVSGTFSVGTPDLVTGSISPGAELGLAVEPAVSAETFFFNVGMLLGQIGFIYLFLFSRGVSPRWSYIWSHVLSWILTSIEFLFYHSFRYGTQETSQASVFLLGLITNGFTALTHSIIPAYLIHGSGNFFDKASEAGIFTSDVAVLIAVVGTLISGVVLVHFLFKELGGE
ncbi:hypothetical protein [Halorarum halobium]|uniref:hypothetical protein n=1 Tax=Halorarum halobium TaxID=3075121 RepID=UPI0028A7BBDD|nr:hypothetical protein [Halobaculum sp. XH14]